MKIKALMVEVYKNKGRDFSNGGVSAWSDYVYLPCPTGCSQVEEDDPRLCKIVTRDIMGMKYRHIEPVNKPEGIGWMDGGCIVDSSDSRFHDMSGGFPLRLHDRCESQREYDILSR